MKNKGKENQWLFSQLKNTQSILVHKQKCYTHNGAIHIVSKKAKVHNAQK